MPKGWHSGLFSTAGRAAYAAGHGVWFKSVYCIGVKVINILRFAFLNNYLLAPPVLAWCAAQMLKTVLHLIIHKQFKGERLVGAGGWPSSHSALVCALVVAAAKKSGLSSPIFALALLFALVVMYDAMGVRREAGEQARVLNRLLWEKRQEKLLKQMEEGDIDYGRQLKEMVGHTPFQVFSGAMLGILIALVVPIF